ncbi:glycosyltransferase family 4 protein [Mucilaginibacter sp. HD30]
MSKHKTRIAMISEHASPLASLGSVDTGGQNVYVAQLAKYLARQGYVVDVYTRRDDTESDEIVNWIPGVRVIHINAGPQESIIKEEMLQYMPEFKDNMLQFIIGRHLHYALVHANFFMSALVAMGIKEELDIPFVVTFHALGQVRRLHQAGNDKFPVERLAIEKAAVDEAAGIIAECPQDKNDLIEYYAANEQKITIIPCGFSDTEFYPVKKELARRLTRLPQDDHVLLQLGRMVPRKGIDNVIKALAYLPESSKHYRLVIVGGEKELENCEEYKRLMNIAATCGVQQMVKFIGPRDRDLLKYYYSAADVFITTPWYEPFGITPLEAMACGTPVIGANVGGVKYSVADNITGALVPPDDPQSLAQKIFELISDQNKLDQMGQNAIEHVNTNFTWHKVAEQVGALYRQLTTKPGVGINIGAMEESRAA